MPNYTKNPTWADGSGGGTAITAAKLNNAEGGIFDAHYPAAVRVTHNAAQSTTNVTPFTVLFNTERFDTESNAGSTQHDNSTNPERLIRRDMKRLLNMPSDANGARSIGRSDTPGSLKVYRDGYPHGREQEVLGHNA